MKIIKCKNCQEKEAEIIRLEQQKHFWIEMCNTLAEQNEHLQSRTLYGILQRTIQIVKHARLP
jgi:protein-arginine kinase activator protein McsA